MSGMNENKTYQSFKIPGRRANREGGRVSPRRRANNAEPVSAENSQITLDGLYYEIEYDASPIPGAGKFVAKPQIIKEPEEDEIRKLFAKMRDIARPQHFVDSFSRFYDKRVQRDSAVILYKQGMFMKDFTDDYAETAPLTQYFTCYQNLGYEQLRTFFTWRTTLRKGKVSNISLSYAFLYIYELLNNIGVDNPQDGLDRLMDFWKAFRVYQKAIDKYVLRWLKDYHVYYELPCPFKEFIRKNNLSEHFPFAAEPDDTFNLYCAISKYDIRKSTFYAGGNARMVEDCFYFIYNKLKQIFAENGMSFDDSIFQPAKKAAEWKPFQDALFYQGIKQQNRRVVLSENEIYFCRQNKWTFGKAVTSENGRLLMGYMMKQMESILRGLMKYKFKLSVNISTAAHPAIVKLHAMGFSIEAFMENAVTEFYREATKTVVKVDHNALSIIRQEALSIQEKLIVSEQEEQNNGVIPPTVSRDEPLMPLSDSVLTVWERYKNALTPIETEALSVILSGDRKIKSFADEHGIMPEVLIDGINEKAMDFIGDNLLDDAFNLYGEYTKNIKELIS